MRAKIIFILTLFFIFFKNDIFCQDSNIKELNMLDELIQIDYEKFIGKPVDSLIQINGVILYEEYIYFDNKPGLLSGIILIFADDINIEITVYEYVFLEQFNVERNWDIELFKKEKVSSIKLIHNNECIKESGKVPD